MQGGRGRFRFLPLGPPAPPVTPLKRSLREGYGTVRRVCTALKGATIYGGGAAERKRSLGGIVKPPGCFEPFPFRPLTSFVSTFPARGDSFWVVLPPACPERGGGCEQSEQTEGLNRGFAICPQPLSRLAATAPRPGSLLAFCNHHPKAVPVYGGFEPSARGGAFWCALQIYT